MLAQTHFDVFADSDRYLQARLDELVERIDQRDSDLADARTQFEACRGKVFEDEPLWELWTQGFLEWVVVERNTGGQTIAATAAQDESLGPPVKDAYRALASSHRSLFRVDGRNAGTAELHDLVGGCVFRVLDSAPLAGVNAQSVVEGRVVALGDDVVFRGLCYHDPEVSRELPRLLKARRETGANRLALADLCASLHVRSNRYRHMSPYKVYLSALA